MAEGFSFEEAKGGGGSQGFSFEEAHGKKPAAATPADNQGSNLTAMIKRMGSLNDTLRAHFPKGNPKDDGLAFNLIDPVVQDVKGLGHDLHRWYDAPKPKGLVESLPGMSPDVQRMGSVAGDAMNLAFDVTGIPETYNALVTQPYAALTDKLAAPKGMTKEQQHAANVDTANTAMWGLGLERGGLAAKLEPTPKAAGKPAEAPKPAEATKPQPTPKPQPEPRPEPVAATPGVKPPKKKRVRPLTTLSEPFTFEEAHAAAEAPKPPEAVQGQEVPEELHATTGLGAGPKQPVLKPIEAADPLNIEPLEKGVYDMAADLNVALGLNHRQGRIGGGRNVLGVYKIKPDVVRTRAMHEIDTLAHEGGHALEYKKTPELTKTLEQFSAAKGHAEPLEKMAYPGANPRALRQEGFAEFFRWYITYPEEAKRQAPQFYEAFEASLQKDDPKLLESLQNTQAHYQALLHAPSAAVSTSQIADATPPGGIKRLGEDIKSSGGPMSFAKNFADALYTGAIDRFHPFTVARRRLLQIAKDRSGKDVDLEVFQDPAKLFRMTPGARGAGHQDVMHGVHDYHSLEPSSPPLVDAIRDAIRKPDGSMPAGADFDKRYKEFSAYLNDRNMKEQWLRYRMGQREFPPDSIPPAVHEQAIKTFEAGNPHWADQAAKVYEWGNAIWKKRFEAGFLTKRQYASGLENHPDYVPAYRDMTNPGVDQTGADIRTPSKRGGDTGKYAGGVKRQIGSSRRVIDPLWSLGQQAYELSMLIARNDAVKALDELATKKVGAGAGAIYERIPAKEIKGTEVPLGELIENIAKKEHLSERDEIELEQAVETLNDLFGEDAKGKIYRATDMNERGDPIIYHWRKGQRIAGQLANGPQGRMMVQALSNMNRPMRGLWINILATPARVLRGGVVLHPKFMLANIEGDQLTNAVLNKGYVPFADWIRGATKEVQGVTGADKDHTARKYNVLQGAVGGMQSAAERQTLARRNLKELARKGFSIVELPEKIATATEISETGSRLGLFMKAMKEAEDRGLGEYEAGVEGSYRARDILDFDRRGGWPAIQAITRMVPFLNANAQGVDKFFRTATPDMLFKALRGDKPTTAEESRRLNQANWALGMVGTIAAADVALRAAYGDDPEYQDVADYLRQTHFVFKIPGTHDIFVYKKPFEAAAVANFSERFYEAAVLHDETAMKKAWGDFFGAFLPSAVQPPILSIPFNLAANKDPFGNPIVPPDKLGEKPEDQYNDYTPDWAIRVGHGMHASPAQLAYTMRASTGYYGGAASAIEDKLSGRKKEVETDLPDAWVISRFVRDATRGNNASKAFWNRTHEFGESEKSMNDLIMHRDSPKEAYERIKKMSPTERGWVMLQFFGHGTEKQAHPFVHAQKAYGVISGLAHDIETGAIRTHAGGKPIELTPHQRREAIDALHDLNMAQLHDSLRDMGESGWKHARPLDRIEPIRRLKRVSPELDQALTARYSAAEIMPLSSSEAIWKSIHKEFERVPSEAEFTRMARGRHDSGRTAQTRMLRAPAR